MKLERKLFILAFSSLLLTLFVVACSPQGGAQKSTTKTLFVGSEQIDCESVAPQKCLLVKDNLADEYTYLYDKIGGFEWEEGFEYELIVEDKELENPPADGSTLRYELVEIVSKKAVAISPSISFLDAKWSLGELSIDGETIRMPEDSTAYLIIEGDNVSGTTGCNNFMGTATFDNGSVTFAPLAVTRKMCIDEALMTFETSLLGLFENATTFSAGRDTLELGNADGTMTTLFTRVAEQTLYVGPEQADCVGVGPQKCLLVKDNPEDEYTFFYSHIAGFEWEAGSEYELRVEIIQILNPPADASSLRYELVEIVSQVEVSGEQ